ncbi:MAG: hypothetical protein LUC86_04085 [Prevotellaceae bacterium]|nr:hypothetical protein [Prevotellaceae bacterium]MCD8303988.1 hypothetical protein [Prevotellaceae bacterium]
MKETMKRLAVCLAAVAICSGAYAADDEEPSKKKPVDASVGMDLVSTYVWRGQKNGGVSIQPAGEISWNGLSLGAWGSFAFSPQYNGSDEEIDINLGYAYKGFSVGITDYYLFNNGYPFFKYGGLSGNAHTFEGTIAYDFGFLAVAWSTNFAGTDGVDGNGKRAYSSYLQIDAPFKLGPLDWDATLGVVPYRTSFYAADDSHGFHVNQVALRAEYPIELKHISIPIYGQIVANPSSRDLFFLCGVAISINK